MAKPKKPAAKAVKSKSANHLKAKAKVQVKAKPAPKTARKGVIAPGWIDAGNGYELGIRDGALAARKNGEPLGSVPKPLKETPVGERLVSAIDFLEDHARTVQHTVETWMLRSLPVPRGVLQAVIADEAWHGALKDVWVVAVGANNAVDREAGGFFRGVDKDKGIGVVSRDGETTWLDTENVLIPHPVLLDELDDLRQMAVEIGASQGTSQLFRETFARPATVAADADPLSISQFANAEFSMLQVVTGLAKRLGYRVSGGASVCRVLEGGRFVEARYDLGDGDGMESTTTGDLTFVDDKQKSLAITDVPPVAFSEGMRMASQIHAKRKVEKEDSDV
ncbi:MAG: DUF4132 domain-containing protein [Kofleriaceae bacterium]